jgi:hypothetical protein
MFHASWGPGHNSTDYKKYYAAPPGDIYKVTQYQSAYEPYVVFKKEGPPWYASLSLLWFITINRFTIRCDERFVGYGGNKAACLFEMYLSGMSYYVLADHFIVHQNHLYEETARKNEVHLIFPLYLIQQPECSFYPQRRYNRKVYSEFKEEMCLR